MSFDWQGFICWPFADLFRNTLVLSFIWFSSALITRWKLLTSCIILQVRSLCVVTASTATGHATATMLPRCYATDNNSCRTPLNGSTLRPSRWLVRALALLPVSNPGSAPLRSVNPGTLLLATAADGSHLPPEALWWTGVSNCCLGLWW